MDRVKRAAFLDYLREGLHHLYDPDQLRQSPLAALFGVANRFDMSAAVRNILIDAIEGLKPKDDNPAQERFWRIHDSLYYGYVQRLSQQTVADQLGLSSRQLRREKHAALEALADYLYQKFNLQDKVGEEANQDPATGASAIHQDLEWLKSAPITKPLDLDQALSGVLELVQPLAARYGVRLEGPLTGPLPMVAVHPVAFDQILLNLFSLAITRAAGSVIAISVTKPGWEVLIRLQGTKVKVEAGAPPIYKEGSQRLGMAQQLVKMSKGDLVIADDEAGFTVELAFPRVDQLSVIVVDDNPDLLNLFQRYSQGTRYHLITTRDPEQVLTLAEKFPPQAIMMDVMMPDLDGWKLLGRLRQHPLTQEVPLIVCTILPQEELALSLGASAFLKKPVSQSEFLAALDRQVAMRESESR